jgi:hypothetical protein
MVSEAEERRLRFIAAKQEAGGSIKDLLQSVKQQPYTVWFDDDGVILCITQEEIQPQDHWTYSHQFTAEQLEILKNKNWNLFYVKRDPLVDNLFSIESRPTENVFVSADTAFLSLIPISTSNYDIACSMTKNQFVVTASTALLAAYENVAYENIAANGKKVLTFYFTAQNDPHLMFGQQRVSLPNLIRDKQVRIPLSSDFTQCSIYTVKLFDKYVRT